jgi:hypothetical protein
MAKVKSHLFSVMRGSVAGITYTANTFSAIIARARTTPTNPSSPRQQQVRAAFTQAKTVWQTLSRIVRNAWDAWADTVTLSGPLGPYTVPGRQWFIGIRGLIYYLAQRGLVFFGSLNSAPVIPGLLPIPLWVVTSPPSGAGYTITFSPITTEQLRAFTFRSIAWLDDKNFFQGPFLTETLLAAHQTLISDPIVLDRIDLTADSVYFEHIRIICVSAPFRISQDLFLRITAVSGASAAIPAVRVIEGKKGRIALPAAT